MKYLLGIDQSTQGTKALLFDEQGRLAARADRPHRQYVDERGWVEHDPEEIFSCTLGAVRDVLETLGIAPSQVAAAGISNQRETAMIWSRRTGKPVYNAVVWQCPRGEAICRRLEGDAQRIQERTGLRLSPYFSAAKLAWILENVPGVREQKDELCCGTMDSWLLYKLTGSFKTDYSNAARTQLFDIHRLRWDPELCALFGVPLASLAEVCGSDSLFGTSDFGGIFPSPIPIHAVLGDSNGALFGQGCLTPGKAKATYGTGSSVMLHVGSAPVRSPDLSSSIAWGRGGRVEYVLEGNINYTGSVIGWLKNEVGLLSSNQEAHVLPLEANPADKTYFVPAFTGLGAPYWDSGATGMFTGISRNTGRAELVRACVDSIAYQITDILLLMQRRSGVGVAELKADGGPTENRYLMQRQSDLGNVDVLVPETQELSGMGAAYAAGIACGFYDESVLAGVRRTIFRPAMDEKTRASLYGGWQSAVRRALTK